MRPPPTTLTALALMILDMQNSPIDGGSLYHAVHGLLQEGTFVPERDELLGHLLAAHRPEPLPLSACHDDDEPVAGIRFDFHLA